MKFEKHPSCSGVSLKGYVRATYLDLVEVFGEPSYGPDDYELDKTTCEWHLRFEDGTLATIYDWKTGETPTQLYSWHVGGKSMKAVDLINETFEENANV